jgi:hypothetical protein
LLLVAGVWYPQIAIRFRQNLQGLGGKLDLLVERTANGLKL